MTQYQIVCTNMQDCHIGSVGTGDGNGYSARWTVEQVLSAMRRNDVFYTVSPTIRKIAIVHPFTCGRCGRHTLRSAADAVLDNNLDNLNMCRVA